MNDGWHVNCFLHHSGGGGIATCAVVSFLSFTQSASGAVKYSLLMKLVRFVLGAAAGIFFLCSNEAGAGEPTRGHTQIKKRVTQAPRLTASQKKLQETRQKLIRRKKDSRDGLANLVMAYEKKLESQTADYLRIKESYAERGARRRNRRAHPYWQAVA